MMFEKVATIFTEKGKLLNVWIFHSYLSKVAGNQMIRRVLEK